MLQIDLPETEEHNMDIHMNKKQRNLTCNVHMNREDHGSGKAKINWFPSSLHMGDGRANIVA